MPPVHIPAHLQADVGSRNYHDAYFIDVKLKSGKVYRGLCAREGKAITGTFRDPSDGSSIAFTSEDIAAVRPSSMLVPFFVTELLRELMSRRS